ncbi:hypothetical protein B0H11DRAFT_1197292 [Mycena galericulata]|nr:hypothetical protein B0H11DRAFT_1197292 [Mycena galericulata]
MLPSSSMSVIEYYQEPDPPFDMQDRRALIEYHSKLEAARNLAELNGLESGLRFTLDLTLPPPNPLPRSRSLPQFPPQSHVSFLLDQALQSGAGKNSQVWTAVAEVAGTQTTVVFKIIQPSMCEYPEADGYQRTLRAKRHGYTTASCTNRVSSSHISLGSILLSRRPRRPHGFWCSNTSSANHCSRSANHPRDLSRIPATCSSSRSIPSRTSWLMGGASTTSRHATSSSRAPPLLAVSFSSISFLRVALMPRRRPSSVGGSSAGCSSISTNVWGIVKGKFNAGR